MFPIIEHIDDVLPHIKGSQEFLVAKRGPYTAINYVVVTPDTFPSLKVAGGSKTSREAKILRAQMRRECRGLIFDKNGLIIRRPYHKFFNMDEREETLRSHINFDTPHIIMEKLDGSMITPMILGNELYWATRMGITDVAMEAAKFANARKNYVELARACGTLVTPIFEWCSRTQQIVIDYPEDTMYLTAVRNNRTGKYTSYQTLKALGELWDIPIPKLIDGRGDFVSEVVHKMDNVEMEGIVVRFDNGNMIKVKTAWYALRHKSKDLITREKDVLEVIFNERLDDIKSYLEEQDRNRIEKFCAGVLRGIEEYAEGIWIRYQGYRKHVGYDRRRFALELAENIDSVERSICYRLWDLSDTSIAHVVSYLTTHVKNNISTSTKIETVRKYWGGLRWVDF